MTDNSPVPHVNTINDRNTQMSTQISETVKMSTYKIKKQLEAQRAEDMTFYALTEKAISEDILPLIEEISDRVRGVVKEQALLAATSVLNTIATYIEVGAEDTYFHDNRTERVANCDIIEAMISCVDSNVSANSDVMKAEAVSASYRLNIWGSLATEMYRLDAECDVLFTPKTIKVEVKLLDEEIGTLSNYLARHEELKAFNASINEIDKKLKDMGNIAEDIEFAMLQAKAKAEGNTHATEVADKITDAILNGVNPSTLFLTNS